MAKSKGASEGGCTDGSGRVQTQPRSQPRSENL